MEKLIFPVSVTQKEQLSGVFIFKFNFDANLALPSHPCTGNLNQKMKVDKNTILGFFSPAHFDIDRPPVYLVTMVTMGPVCLMKMGNFT